MVNLNNINRDTLFQRLSVVWLWTLSAIVRNIYNVSIQKDKFNIWLFVSYMCMWWFVAYMTNQAIPQERELRQFIIGSCSFISPEILKFFEKNWLNMLGKRLIPNRDKREENKKDLENKTTEWQSPNI